VCTVCPVCGILFCVKVNAIYFRNFRNEKNAPFTLDFSGVYFGPITGGVFVFFPKRIPRGTLFEVFSVTIRTGLTLVVRKFPAPPQRMLMEVFISSVHCIILLAFPNFRILGLLASFGSPVISDGITMLPSSLIMFEIRVTRATFSHRS
jgi:hypothetical protein